MKKLVLAMVCLACSSTAFAAEVSKELDYLSFGEDWPLTFQKAKVSCINKRFVFVYNTDTDDRYPVNGNAKNAVQVGKMEGEDLATVWADNPDYKGLKKNIGPILDAGLALCDK